jgi:hypothetical protein
MWPRVNSRIGSLAQVEDREQASSRSPAGLTVRRRLDSLPHNRVRM